MTVSGASSQIGCSARLEGSARNRHLLIPKQSLSTALLFDNKLKPFNRVVPLSRCPIKILSGLGQRIGPNGELTVPPHEFACNHAGLFENCQMLSDALAGKASAMCKLCDGPRSSIAELGQESQPGLITQCCKNRGRGLGRRCRQTIRHGRQYCQPASSSLRCCLATPQAAGDLADYQIRSR